MKSSQSYHSNIPRIPHQQMFFKGIQNPFQSLVIERFDKKADTLVHVYSLMTSGKIPFGSIHAIDHNKYRITIFEF